MSQDKIELTLEPRTTVGKAVRQLRREGVTPAVIHDHGKDSVLVQADRQVLTKAYLRAGKHHPIALTAGGKSYIALIKTVDFEPKKHTIRHIVFGAVNAREKVEAEVPVHPHYAEGNEMSPAERGGLLVISNVSTVIVEATPSNLPDELTYDAEKLVEVGDSITVAELSVPEHVEIKTEPETVVATVYEPSAIAAANDALAGEAEEGKESEAGNGGEEATEAAAEGAAAKAEEAKPAE